MTPPEEESLRDTVNRLEVLIQFICKYIQMNTDSGTQSGKWVREILKDTIFIEENDAAIREFLMNHRFRHHTFRFCDDADKNSKPAVAKPPVEN